MVYNTAHYIYLDSVHYTRYMMRCVCTFISQLVGKNEVFNVAMEFS